MDGFRQEKRYTYADYLTWNEDVRYELIDGVPYMLAAPGIAHQRISRRMLWQLENFLRDKPCEVFDAPIDIRLNADEDDDNVVEPDLIVVCDPSKLADGKACIGAPDMVIEILSPSTSARDKVLKFNRYLQAGVPEYWIVNPEDKTVSANILKNGEYTVKAYGEQDTVPVHVLDGCTIGLQDVFAE